MHRMATPLLDIAVADALMQSLDARAMHRPFTLRDSSFDATRAYAVLADIHRRRVARGEHPVGRKIGFTNRNIWPQYGVYAPLWAPIYSTTVAYLTGDAGTVSLASFCEPRIEPEIVLHFARAPGAARTAAELVACIDWIAHGYEIVQSPYPDWKFQAPDTIAAFGLHGRLLIGTPQSVAGSSVWIDQLARFTIALDRNGLEHDRGGGANVLDSPLKAPAHFLDLLATQPAFAALEAGEIVTTGSLTGAWPIVAGEHWSTRFDGIALPSLRVAFVS